MATSNLLERMKQERITNFKALWNDLNTWNKRLLLDNAKTWNTIYSARYTGTLEVNALRAAGAQVHIFGSDAQGMITIDVINWSDLAPEVIDIMLEWKPDDDEVPF